MQYRINRSALVVLLEQWERDMPAPQRQDVAERLSQWLGAMDAVRLNAALHAIESHVAAAPAKTVDVDLLAVRYEQGLQDLAALVEQMAAAASSLRSQSDALVHTVSVFKL